jgi:hypothetical protein
VAARCRNTALRRGISALAAARYTARAFSVPGDVAVAELCDESAGVRVCIAPGKGAELASYQVRPSCVGAVPVNDVAH